MKRSGIFQSQKYPGLVVVILLSGYRSLPCSSNSVWLSPNNNIFSGVYYFPGTGKDRPREGECRVKSSLMTGNKKLQDL